MIWNKHLETIEKLLSKYLPFASQWDESVFKGQGIEHEWIETVGQFTADQRLKFDAFREPSTLESATWLAAISEIKELVTYPVLPLNETPVDCLGNTKKRHELNQIGDLLRADLGKRVFDFGGGVGKLSSFLESNLAMKATVLEQDLKLVQKGRKRALKDKSSIEFCQCHICETTDSQILSECDLAIGLHTCGRFANDMLRMSVNAKVNKIVNFGCCYSKITEDDFNISKKGSLYLNQRALSLATLGFAEAKQDHYEYRIQIMNYKFSLYHWLYKETGEVMFLPLGNSRRSLYALSFSEFCHQTLDSHFPNLVKPSQNVLENFFNSRENKKLVDYFISYYSIARYFGELIESYILSDRACFLEDKGYGVELFSVFDQSLSPRNKALVAAR